MLLEGIAAGGLSIDRLATGADHAEAAIRPLRAAEIELEATEAKRRADAAEKVKAEAFRYGSLMADRIRNHWIGPAD